MSRRDELFVDRYALAREAFCTAAAGQGATLESVELPGVEGPDGEVLAVDVARLGALSASRWLVIISGTHGVEGYYGSALQRAWLRALPARAALADEVSVLLVHALNPYGMAWWSRTDHDNVDVNRNFLAFPARAANPGYEELHAVVCGPQWDPSSRARLAERLGEFESRHGRQALTDALIAPQSAFADGMNYTGVAPSWSRGVIERQLDAIASRAPSRVMLIDLHTGVAPAGGVAVLHFPDDDQDARRARSLWDVAEPGFQFGAQGLANYSGLLVQGARRRLGKRSSCVVAEVGTVDRLAIREALRLDRWLRFHAKREGCEGERRQLFETFCPSDPGWRSVAVARGIRLLELGLQGLAGSGQKGSEQWDGEQGIG